MTPATFGDFEMMKSFIEIKLLEEFHNWLFTTEYYSIVAVMKLDKKTQKDIIQNYFSNKGDFKETAYTSFIKLEYCFTKKEEDKLNNYLNGNIFYYNVDHTLIRTINKKMFKTMFDI